MVQPTQGLGQPTPAYNNYGENSLNKAQSVATTVEAQRVSEEAPQMQDDPVNLTRKADNDSRNGQKPQRECETCKNRKYVDGSDDPGVSFKTPTAMSPEKAATAVRAHEQEHVTHERAKAASENREVVNQSVILYTAICPECGNSYISGGLTTTVTKNADETNKKTDQYQNGEGNAQIGGVVDAKA